jgi:hypothetical protein
MSSFFNEYISFKTHNAHFMQQTPVSIYSFIGTEEIYCLSLTPKFRYRIDNSSCHHLVSVRLIPSQNIYLPSIWISFSSLRVHPPRYYNQNFVLYVGLGRASSVRRISSHSIISLSINVSRWQIRHLRKRICCWCVDWLLFLVCAF